MDKRKLVFFDAECLVCNHFGHFILRNSAHIHLAPIGGQTYQKLQLPEAMRGVDAIVYWNGRAASIQSEALQEIGRDLGGLWQFLSWMSRLLPTRFLNYFYDRFARIRYRIFGKVESCALIPKEYRSRLILD